MGRAWAWACAGAAGVFLIPSARRAACWLLSSPSLLPALFCSNLQLPQGAERLAVFMDGTESEQDVAALKVGWCRL